MCSQHYLVMPKALCLSFILFMSSFLLADLELGISQIYPTPPLANCQDSTGVPVLVGGTVTYAITVTNSGSASVRGFSLTDTLDSDVNPSGICFVDVNPFCEGIVTSSGNSFQIDSRQTLAPGESITFTATFRICTGLNAQGFSTLTNTASITATDTKDRRAGTGPSTLTSCVQGCALSTLILPAVATNICQNGSITLKATVAGSCSPNLNYNWFAPSSTVPVLSGPSNELVLQASDIPFNGAVYTVVVTDLFTQCSAQSSSGPLSVIECTDLQISKNACLNDDTITYTIVVSNIGQTPSSVAVTDCLPDCLTPLAVNSLLGVWSPVQNGNTISVQLTEPSVLQPGTSASFEIIASISDECDRCVYNTATVQGSIFNTNQENSASAKIKLW